MSIYSGPEIDNTGLVFYYDMGNTQRSWIGAPTVNLKTNPDFSNGTTSYNTYVSPAPTVVSVTDFPGSLGQPKTVLQCTSAAAPGGGGNSGGMVFDNPTLTVGLAYTISFWAIIRSHASATNTFSNQNGSGDNSNFAFSTTITNQWQKYSFTTNSLNLFKIFWYVWTNQNSATWQYAEFQIEQQSFATPFVVGTRSNTQALLDLTGQNTITASSLTYASDNTFSFNGSSNLAIFPENSALNTQTPTVEVWVKTNALSQNGFWFEKGTVNSQYALFQEGGVIQWRLGPLGDLSTTTASFMNTTNWFQVVGTFTSGDRRLYINGVQVNSNTTTGTLSTNTNGCSIGVYGGFSGGRGYYYNGSLAVVKVYNRALSASEVNQNFQALRSRFGI